MLTPDEILTRARALAEHAIANRDRCGAAARELLDWTARGAPLADKQEQSARLEICHACEHWKPVGDSALMHCAQCKCLAVKLKLKTSVCPLSKW